VDDGSQELREQGQVLAQAISDVLPGWVERSVRRRLEDAGREAEPAVMAAAAEAGKQAAARVGQEARELLERDVDQQRTTPLTLMRRAVRYPTAVLREAQVPPVDRDEAQQALFPDDPYDLSPASYGDVDPSLAEPGLLWGAAKAFAHLKRHKRAENG
jgi:hypothetical protein